MSTGERKIDEPTLDDGEVTLAGADVSRVETRTLAQGDAVGRYVVLGRLGSGAMGVVYLAYDPELDRKVALKLLHAAALGIGESDGSKRTRLVREAQAMARLSHPNVITVHDVGEHKGVVFLAMEFVEGGTLKTWLADESRAWPEVVDVMLAAGQGLAAAHRAGLVHRDFKPDNVMIASREGRVERVVVMDFGLARPDQEASGARPELASSPRTSALTEDLTMDGTVVGTPAYMSVEQLSGFKTDARADQFAFCVTLHEALYGLRPFRGTDLGSLAAAILYGKLEAPPADTRVPRRIHRVIERGLRAEARDRYATMDDLLAELGRKPGRRAAVLVASGLVVAAAAGAWGFASWTERRASEQCREAGEAVASVWNENVEAELARAFTDIGAAWSVQAWERNAARLDEYADRWAEVREDVCRAAHVHGTMSTDLEQSEVLCLDARRDHLSELVELLRTPDRVMAAASVVSVASLAPIDPCRDESVARWYSDVELGDDAKRLRHDRERAAALLALERAAETRDGAEKVRQEADALGLHALALEAELDAAQAAADLPDYPSAERESWHVYVAATALGRDDIAMRAITYHAYVVGYLLSRPDDGLRSAELANALLERLSLQGGAEEADLLLSWASVYAFAGRSREARTAIDRAIEIRREIFGSDHPALAILYGAKGTIVALQGQAAEARQAHLDALTVTQAAFGPDHPAVAARLNNIAGAYVREGNFHEAESYAKQALSKYRASGTDESTLAGILVNLGMIARSLGRREEAVEHYRQALDIHTRISGAQSLHVGDVLMNLGTVYADLGDHERALEQHRQSLAAYESSVGPNHMRTLAALQNAATATMNLHRYDEARALFESVVARAAETESAEDVEGIALMNLAALHAEQGDHRKARELAERSVRVKEAAFGRHHPSVALTLHLLAQELRELGEEEEVQAHLERALVILESNGTPHDRGGVRFELAQVLDRGERALELAEQARADFESVGARDVDRVAEVDAWLAKRR